MGIHRYKHKKKEGIQQVSTLMYLKYCEITFAPPYLDNPNLNSLCAPFVQCCSVLQCTAVSCSALQRVRKVDR